MELNNIVYPTLVIGLGGVGTRVVTRLKARVLEDEIPLVQFLAVDSNIEELRASNLPPNEQLYIGGVGIKEFLQARDTSARQRTMVTPEIMSFDSIDVGTAGIRAAGRMALLWHERRFVDALLRCFSELRSVAASGTASPRHSERIVASGELRVLIVASTLSR